MRRLSFYLGGGWWVVDGGWCPTFWFFKSLDNNMVYSLGIDIYMCKRNLCRTKVLWVLKFGEVGDRTNKNQNPPRYEAFWFFVQNFSFWGAGCSFWYLFSHFLNYKGRRKKKKENKRTKGRIIEEIRKTSKEKMSIQRKNK